MACSWARYWHTKCDPVLRNIQNVGQQRWNLITDLGHDLLMSQNRESVKCEVVPERSADACLAKAVRSKIGDIIRYLSKPDKVVHVESSKARQLGVRSRVLVLALRVVCFFLVEEQNAASNVLAQGVQLKILGEFAERHRATLSMR